MSSTVTSSGTERTLSWFPRAREIRRGSLPPAIGRRGEEDRRSRLNNCETLHLGQACRRNGQVARRSCEKPLRQEMIRAPLFLLSYAPSHQVIHLIGVIVETHAFCINLR